MAIFRPTSSSYHVYRGWVDISSISAQKKTWNEAKSTVKDKNKIEWKWETSTATFEHNIMADMWHIFMLCSRYNSVDVFSRLTDDARVQKNIYPDAGRMPHGPPHHASNFAPFLADMTQNFHHMKNTQIRLRLPWNPRIIESFVQSLKVRTRWLAVSRSRHHFFPSFSNVRESRSTVINFFIHSKSLTLEPCAAFMLCWIEMRSGGVRGANKFEMENLLIMSTVFSIRFITQKCLIFKPNVGASWKSTHGYRRESIGRKKVNFINWFVFESFLSSVEGQKPEA